MTDVLIVGGGLTGLSLAAHLEAAGRGYRLLEARDRLGGRVLSRGLGQGGQRYDLGPAWFWPGQARIAGLVQALGLRAFEQFASGLLVFEDGSGAIRRDIAMAPMAGALRVAGGMGALIDGLAERVPEARISLGHRVTSVEQTERGVRVRVQTADGGAEIEVARLVLATPPRLAEATITCTPTLAQPVRNAMRAIPTWMAGHAKVLAIYPRPFWRDQGLSGDAISHRGPLAEIHDASGLNAGEGALFGFALVQAGARRQAGREALLSAAVAQLTRLFGPDAAAPTDIVLTDWAADPLTAVPRDELPLPGHPAYGRPPVLADPWDGRLILASSELGAEAGGFLEGALEVSEAVAATLC